MTRVPASEIRDGDVIRARHGIARVKEQFRDIERNGTGYRLGDVTLTIRYDDGREFTFTVAADHEITRVRYA